MLKEKSSHTITNKQLLDLYWNKNMSLQETGIQLGYAASGAATAIRRLFNYRNLPTRNRSESCQLRWQVRPNTFHRDKTTGENHWRWKGGRIDDGHGYIMVKNPTHHRTKKSGYVLEHILIWETTHHKQLPKGWVIHHINGIRQDNRPENLLAVHRDRHEHYTVVKNIQARIRELEQLHLRVR